MFLLVFALLDQTQALTCMAGRAENGNLTEFKPETCEADQGWCFSLHSTDKNKPILDLKSCWNEKWEHGVYNKFGCITGQHCIDGTCYENATVCLCKYEDNCNDFLNDGMNDTHSTPLPYPPSTPKGGLQCWYGIKENDTSSLDQNQTCINQEQLCVRITHEEDNFEYRSCWESDFNIEYSRPGCYKGFSHCHRDVCHNDTTICVCADPLCNDEDYSSEAPPITPGSGLYCWRHDYHPDGPPGPPHAGPEGEPYVECAKNEDFCIETTDTEHGHVMFRGCWSTDYEEGRYNFTGCEVGTHCMFGDCYNNTVCLCKDNLCNDFQLNENATTVSPSPMTTTNTTMHCWYGMQHNSSTPEEWQVAVCAPEETTCMYIDGDNGFHLAGCYDYKYNGGVYNHTGCYETGQHCWDNQCHNGTLCVCDKEMCNNPKMPTSSPAPVTPGSGLDCWYGNVWGEGEHKQNLTKKICNKNESMCIAAYGSGEWGHMAWFDCHDNREQNGLFNQSDVCIEGLYCFNDDHHHGPPGRIESDPPHCTDSNVCTCNTSLCNNYNSSSTFSPGTEPPTQPNTMRCWFGEKHHGTGNETWKVEVCQANENHCYQITSPTGFESRECWDLNYEDEEYAGDGCYRGKHCHHEHCFDDVTVCICNKPLCNDWTEGGNVTTDHPVTDGSGIICYGGKYPNISVDNCARNETTCSYLLTSDGEEYGSCYDPTKNDGKYYTDACFENVDIDDAHGHLKHGKFCVCDGEKDDLCNEDYFKHRPDNGVTCLTQSLISLLLFSMILLE